MNNVIINDSLIDGLLTEAMSSKMQRANLLLHERNYDACLRMVNALLPTAVVPIHRHRNSTECLTILKGHIVVVMYGESGGVEDRIPLGVSTGNYAVQIKRGQWHTIEILEPSAILEVKEGPYEALEPEDIMN